MPYQPDKCRLWTASLAGGFWFAILLASSPLSAAEDAAEAPRPEEAGAATGSAAPPDPYRDVYRDYEPDYLKLIDTMGIFHEWKKSEKEMRLSTEPRFFTLNVLDIDSRANALVEAAIEKERAGQFREALKMHQIVIEKYPLALYRVSEHGVYVPAAQYCQRRLLNFPKSDLDFYRQLYDGRAREEFEQARRNYSLIGLSEIVDSMLATSYGDDALFVLGNAALDAGHHLEALEHFEALRRFFRESELLTPALDLKIAYCRKMLGREAAADAAAAPGAEELSPEHLAVFRKITAESQPREVEFHSQHASESHFASDDYTLFPPSPDPLALETPVWRQALPGSQGELLVFSQPVVTENSVIYRHKNIVYARSILNGNLRWKNDMGGRAVWQSRNERQYPTEDLLIQDGLVFTPMSRGRGPSLVALHEVTGELKWAYGPIAASTEEEARMRFESAPAGGPRTVFAGYVLDNIEGDTHTDTEYGLIAFDSTTGRLRWRRDLGRLAPGKFATGFATRRRNRIRSFTSPPVHHEGTVYYCTNAGSIAALDARSGRIKWLIHYPYSIGETNVHDSTREFGGVQPRLNPWGPHSPMFWFNQRPLLVGEHLFVMPVDTRFLFCIDRQTGKVVWSKAKGPHPLNYGGYADGGYTHLLGPTREGHLVLVHSGRTDPVQLVDRMTGEVVWKSPDLVPRDDQPVMKYGGININPNFGGFSVNSQYFHVAARPTLTTEDELYVTSFIHTGPYTLAPTWAFNLAHLSLAERKIVAQRRYYDPLLLRAAEDEIKKAPGMLKSYLELPNPSDDLKERIRLTREIAADVVPENEHGPFLPFSRITFERFGQWFELRFGPRKVEMVFDRDAVLRAVTPQEPAASAE
ncbi:MAG: PQQ-binding-like beta-propeller repeat protein [Planctomycetales bacterium]